MRSFIWATAVAAISANGYVEMERDGASDHPVYYDDATSLYRIPTWMQEDKHKHVLDVNGLQKDGAWNIQNGILDLGNGVQTGTTASIGVTVNGGTTARSVPGTSTAGQSAFVAAVRAHHEQQANAEFGRSRKPNPNDGNQKVWDHIRNFWYRDGDLFALMVDDNACDMMHPPQVDISLDNNDEDKTLKFNIEREDHHLEHLRDFCIRMGGSLWAPSSQEEYDDLFERDSSVCGKHIAGWEDALPVGDTVFAQELNRIEVYINMHRDGYLECPDTDFDVENGLTVEGNYDACPTRYGANTRRRDKIRENYVTYFSTDPNFASNSDDLCPTSAAVGPYVYAKFETKKNIVLQAGQQRETEPYIPDGWWTEMSKRNMRFQKFVQTDEAIINAPFAVKDGTKQRQKDCVTIKCDEKTWTGPLSDQRRQTEWNVEYCNQQKHVGICRVPVTGCNEPSYVCKAGYTNSCGDRAIYTETFTAWLDASTATAVISLIDGSSFTADQKNDMKNPTRLIVGSSATHITTRDVVCTNGDNVQDVQTFINTLTADPVTAIDTCDNTNFPDRCTCKCSFNTWTKWRTAVGIETSLIKDFSDGHVVSTPSCGAGTRKNIGCNNDYSCSSPNNNNCWTGGAKSKCDMHASGNYALWSWDGAAAGENLCTRHCCDAYDDSIHTLASLSSNAQLDYRAGDTYTVSCTGGNHISGEADDVVSRTFTIAPGTPFDQCFTPVTCSPLSCKKCPVLENGYCHYATKPSQTVWATGTKLRCRCNKCYGLRNAPHHLPFEDAVCNAPDFDGPNGVCVPVRCANPKDLILDGKVVGWPAPLDGETAANYKAKCGEKIFYNCAPGYVYKDGVQPSTECNQKLPTADEGDWGPQGYYGDIVGSCVPNTHCKAPPQGEDHAWDAAYMVDDTAIANDCHAEATYTLGSNADMIALNADGSKNYPHGTYAVFECFDDFGAIKRKNFRNLMKNAALEISCGAGSKGPAENCRENFTTARRDAPTFLNTNNDKVISRCWYGVWETPSHKCECNDQIAQAKARHLKRHLAVFNPQCEARGGVVPVDPTGAPPITASSCPKLVFTALGLIPAVFLH